jgi:hypothetical protein
MFAIALAVAACQVDYSIHFTSVDDLVRQLRAAEDTDRDAGEGDRAAGGGG